MRAHIIENGIVVNTIIVDSLDFDAGPGKAVIDGSTGGIGWTYADGALLPPDEGEIPVVVPQSVTPAQGGIALINFGLMDAVMAVVNAPDMPATHKWAFERATSWERNSPSFNYIADRAGITEQQKDELFIFGASMTP